MTTAYKDSVTGLAIRNAGKIAANEDCCCQPLCDNTCPDADDCAGCDVSSRVVVISGQAAPYSGANGTYNAFSARPLFPCQWIDTTSNANYDCILYCAPTNNHGWAVAINDAGTLTTRGIWVSYLCKEFCPQVGTYTVMLGTAGSTAVVT